MTTEEEVADVIARLKAGTMSEVELRDRVISWRKAAALTEFNEAEHAAMMAEDAAIDAEIRRLKALIGLRVV